VILPASYGDVESVAHALKAGDVVVLGLKQTPGDLAKRVLDFSFGVASALDASVDCVADKVFVVCRGNGLSDGERLSLKSQGIL
jgi:cell division inhibitor SepF